MFQIRDYNRNKDKTDNKLRKIRINWIINQMQGLIQNQIDRIDQQFCNKNISKAIQIDESGDISKVDGNIDGTIDLENSK